MDSVSLSPNKYILGLDLAGIAHARGPRQNKIIHKTQIIYTQLGLREINSALLSLWRDGDIFFASFILPFEFNIHAAHNNKMLYRERTHIFHLNF